MAANGWVGLLGLAVAGCASSGIHRDAQAVIDEPAVRARGGAGEARRTPGQGDGFAQGVGRKALISAVVGRHPGLVAMAHRVRARAAEARSMAALPAPMAMAQLWQAPLHAPFVYGDGSMLMLGIQQSFPPGSMLDAEARGAVEEARSIAAMITVQERELAAQVEVLFVDYREARTMLRLLEEHDHLVGQMAAMARARFSTGASAVSDVARAEREGAQQRVEAEALQGEVRRAVAELNALLGRPAEAPLGPPEEEPAGLPSQPVEELIATAKQRRGEVAAARAMLRREEARGKAAEVAGSAPMYSVGVSYGLGRPGGMPDTWGATFSMTLPWLSGGAAPLREARRHDRQAAASDLDGTAQQIEREVGASLARSRSAARQLAGIERSLVPAAARAVDAARASYAAGPGDGLGWLEAIHALRDARAMQIRARAALDRSLAELDRAVGVELVRSAKIDEVQP